MVTFQNGIESVIETLGRIEGERWIKNQRDHSDGYKVTTLFKAWECYHKEYPEYCEKTPNEFIDVQLVNLTGESVIYGESGYNRYAVRISGEIVCSRYHVSGHKIKAVIDEGIAFY
ncbi:hypothetical protein ACQ4M3_39660 [Leptolyngbya sp. AN03gr2]|uniref:hypothetical protein n=1 Tax=unclassified Leptolyngbya TaxID=2650499 RepID=UPI003D31E0A9